MEWFIFALGAAVINSLVALIEKKALFKEHAAEFSATIAVLNFLVILPFFFLVDFSFSIMIWVLMAVAAFFASIGFLFVAKAVRHMEISAASPLLNFGPGFTAIVAILILGEVLTPLNILGILTLIAGSYVLEIDFRSHDITTPFRKIYKSRYIHYIFLALGSYSLSAVSCKYILNFVNPVTLIFVEQFFVALIFVAILYIFYDGVRGISNGMKSVGWLLLVMAVMTVSYRLLQATAIKMTFVSLVMPIKRLSTLFATVMGGELFREHGLYQKVAACIIMIVGAVLVIMG
ncbi:MAG: EamA family transporter [archaeon]|nr:MAG: EamA family transporter [archaeon]